MTACSNHRTPVDKKIITTQQQSKLTVANNRSKSAPAKKRKRTPYRRPALRNYSFSSKLSNAALERLRSRVRYDGSYVKIAYPWGDVPANTGVCTDVVIRSYRRLGIDLQQQVHNDMSAAFTAYPNVKKWGLSKPDPNIDHRRVYNLRAFFTRRGAAMPVTHNSRDYKPGDLVTWMVGKDLPHIGVVVNRRSKADPSRYMIVHNIAYGPQLDDVLFRFPITGHYRYTPRNMRNIPKPSNFVSRKATQRNNASDYAQLVAAAKILDAHTGKTAKAKKQVANKIKEIDPIVLATLTDTEIQNLLK